MKTILSFLLALISIFYISAQPIAATMRVMVGMSNSSELRACINVLPLYICNASSYDGNVTVYGNIPWLLTPFPDSTNAIITLKREENDSVVSYFTLQGQRITQPQRGQLVIARYSDGTSRKMVVK